MDKLPAIMLFAAIVFAGIALTYYMQNQELKALLPKPKASGGCGCGCATCSGHDNPITTTPVNNGGYTTV